MTPELQDEPQKACIPEQIAIEALQIQRPKGDEQIEKPAAPEPEVPQIEEPLEAREVPIV